MEIAANGRKESLVDGVPKLVVERRVPMSCAERTLCVATCGEKVVQGGMEGDDSTGADGKIKGDDSI